MKRKSLLSYGFMVFGMTFSVMMVIASPDFYHSYDTGVFDSWASTWSAGWSDLWITCTECNYPILGVIGSAGVYKILYALGVPDVIWGFRIVLGVVDGLNVLLVFLLLRQLSIKNAAFWAGLIGILISSWAGTSVWGQTDGISQFFMLLTVLWMVFCNLSKRIPFVVYLAVFSLLLSFVLLVKQTTIFSVAGLEFLLLVSIFYRRKWISAAGYAILQLVLLGLCIFAWDLTFALPKPNISHLQLIFGARSDSGSTLSGLGVNLWTFMNQRMETSSGLPLPFAAHTILEKILTPHKIGGALFLLLAALLSVSILLFLIKSRNRDGVYMGREEMLNFLLYLAVINLIFNVVWTGAHERWLHHFYPFLLIAYLGLREYDRRFSKILLLVILAGSTIYGMWILWVIHGTITGDYYLQRCLSGFHLVFLCLLLFISLRYQSFIKNARAFLQSRWNRDAYRQA
jgi:hypothetical protein